MVNKVDSKPNFNPFAGNTIEKVLPITDSQKEMLTSCIIGGNDANLAYNQSLSLLFTGYLNEDILKKSLQELLNRNEALRSSFSADGTQMIIYSSQPVNLFYQDISMNDIHKQDAIINDYNYKDATTTFDLINGPLIRFALFKKNTDKYLLTITVHHIVCDGWSFGILLEELSSIYNAVLKNNPLQKKSLLFSDYAKRRIEFSTTKEYAEIEKYWLDEFKNNIPYFEIPPDYPRPRLRTYKSTRYDYTLSRDMATAAQKAGAKYGCSFVNLLMSVLEILLYKYTGNNDVVIGLPTAGQTATEMFYLIGHCVNFLPLRSHPDDELSFAEYLRVRKSKTLNDYEHQQFTFGSLLQKLNIKRDPSRIPLAPVSFNIYIGMNMNVSFDNVAHEIIYNPRVCETFELFLNITESKNGYDFQWSYNTQLYKDTTIKGLMEKYLFLLHQIINNPEEKIKCLQIESNQSILNRLKEWNNTDYPLPNKTVIELFEETVLQYPDNIAVKFNNVQLTYSELNEKSNQLAHYLKQNGVGTGSTVGVILNRGIPVAVSMLAAFKCDATYVPIDPEIPDQRIQFMIDNSETSFNIINRKYEKKFNSKTKQIVFEDIENELQKYSTSNLQLKINLTSISYILYTSGSTGQPKGVMITQKNLLNCILGMKNIYQTNEYTRLLAVASISFDVTAFEIFLPLISGSTIVIADENTIKNINFLIKKFEDDQINFIAATPTLYKLAIDWGWEKKILGTVISCAEPLSKKLAAELLKRCEKLYNMYAPTETTIYSIATQIFGDEEIIALGKPIINTQVYILDENRNVLPEGKAGEIYIGGDGVSNGYLNRMELTAEKFIKNPFVEKASSKLYKSGDVGKFLQDGSIVCLGRVDHQVKVRGFRIELEEVQHQILKIAGIKDVIVIAQNDDEKDDKKLIAFVIPKDYNNNNFTKDEILGMRSSLKEFLPWYMIPEKWVKIAQFPVNQNKKIDRKALEKIEIKVVSAEQLNSGVIGKDVKVIDKVKYIWESKFGIKGINSSDDFFKLGGHSLLAARVMHSLNDELKIELPITTIFRFPVLKDLSQQYADKLEKGKLQPGLQQIKPSEEDEFISQYPLTESQLEIFHQCIIGGDEANLSYNINTSQYLTGNLNIDVLKKALQAVVNNHDSLRSTFNEDGTKAIVNSKIELPFFYSDISDESETDKEEYGQKFLKDTNFILFDLVKGPLLNFSLLKLNSDKYLFSFTIHHIICDGTSLDILIGEISNLYNAYLNNISPKIQKFVQYAKYAMSQQLVYATQKYNDNFNYWLLQFKDGAPILDIPTDFPYPVNRSFRGHINYFDISEKDTLSLQNFAKEHSCSLTILLRVIFEVLIYKYTGQDEFVIGLPVSDINGYNAFDLVGHYVNMLPVVAKMGKNIPFKEFLKNRNISMLNDYDHQQISFGSLIKKINVTRTNSRNTLINISFASQIEIFNNRLNFEGVESETIPQKEGYNSFEITIEVYKHNNNLNFKWLYSTQLFFEDTIKGLMDNYISLLHQIINDPEQKIKDLQVQIENKQETLNKLAEWNNTYYPLPNKTVIELFEETVNQYPDNIAVQFQNQKLTYLQLNNAANQFAHYLQKQNLQQGNVVGIVLDRGPQIIITLLAILKCGATYVPIDPEFPDERIRFMINDAETSLNIINSKYEDKFSSGNKQVIFENIRNELTTLSAENIAVKSKHSDLAYILYTSGSTGKPKGVMITQRNLLNLLLSMKGMFNTDKHTRLLSVTTISFDIVGLEIYLPLISGSTLILTDEKTVKDGAALFNQIKKDKINFIQATPATYKMLIDAGWNKKLPITILSGGEALSKSLASLLATRGNVLYNMYGPTETTIWSTVSQISENDEIISIGRPIQNTQIYILDENRNILPEGKVGEIYIGGEGVAKGYYNRAELTAERFINNPLNKTSPLKLYSTGDLGKFMPDGSIICLGRTDHQAKIRGYRIELEEIEYNISKLNSVKDVIVHIKQNGVGEQRLAAYVIPFIENGNEGYTKEEIIQFRSLLKNVLPIYMIPDEWVKLKEFPLTPNKKVDRKALEKAGGILFSETEKKNGKDTPTAKLIKKIWEEELKIKGINENDNFFELGGYSMVAIKVMSRIEKQTGVKLPIATLFENSTVKSLVEVIDENKPLNDYKKVVIPIKHAGEKLPIFLVHSGGLNILLYKSLSESLDVDQPLYGLQGLGIDGDLTHLKSMETIAKRYLSEVMEHDSEGPYILMGYSYGGLIAFEMVRQLLSMGKEIKVLGILDTNAFTGDKCDSKFQLYVVKLLRQFKKLAFFSKQFVSSPPTFFKYQWLVFNRRYNKNFKDPEEQQVHDYSEFVTQAYDNAYHNYLLQPANVEIDLFRVEKRVYFIEDPAYLGWKKYASKGVKVHSVPGDHKTFMLPPNNKILAITIQNVINSKFIILLIVLIFSN